MQNVEPDGPGSGPERLFPDRVMRRAALDSPHTMLRRRPAPQGRTYLLYAEVGGIRGGEYELHLTRHADEYELPALALKFLSDLEAGCRRLLASPETDTGTGDRLLPRLHLRPVPGGGSQVAVMWRRGVLGVGAGREAALHATLEQAASWRADVVRLYGLSSQ